MLNSLVNKVAGLQASSVFLWNLRNFKEHLFWRTSANGYFFIIQMKFTISEISQVFWIFSWSILLREKCFFIWSFSGPYLPTFGLNKYQKKSEYGYFSRSVSDHFVSYHYGHSATIRWMNTKNSTNR